MTNEPAPLFPDKTKAKEPFADVTMPATLLNSATSPGSASGTPTGVIKFQCPVEEIGALMAKGALYGRTFDVTFEQTGLGILTVLRQSSRADENGQPILHLVFAVPQSELPKKAQIDTRGLSGKKGRLTLGVSQTAMDDVLTRRADEDEGPCPYAGCTLPALHSGKHKVPAEAAAK